MRRISHHHLTTNTDQLMFVLSGIRMGARFLWFRKQSFLTHESSSIAVAVLA
jgi:hypothetical protein